MKGFKNFHIPFEPGLFGMALLRFISSMLELLAAIAMLYFNDIRKALIVNSLLAVIGPIVFITATSIGLISVANTVSFGKLFLIIIGVIFILIGILK